MQVDQHLFVQFLQTIPSPQAIIMVGLPLSGKDTLIKNLNLDSFITLSRDQLMLDFKENATGYRNAYTATDGKELDKKFFLEIQKASETQQNLIINATHLTIKRRRKVRLRLEKTHFCIALILPIISLEDFLARNRIREIWEKKSIPSSVFESMLNLYQPVTESEGFNAVIYWKEK